MVRRAPAARRDGLDCLDRLERPQPIRGGWQLRSSRGPDAPVDPGPQRPTEDALAAHDRQSAHAAEQCL